MKVFGVRDEGKPISRLVFAILGIVITLLIWIYLSTGPVIVPSPWRVLTAFPQLINENELFRHMGLSIGLNITGYIEAILITIPFGFLIGLIKYARWGFQKQVDALRYIPLTAVTLLFILWFGIGIPMKVHFLAFGILIYLLPVMIQRIDEVDDVYLKTVHTLSASRWQTLRTVYIPSVLSRLSDDLRVLTAISWTYIIVAEGINSTQGGLGTLIYYVGQRQVRYDKVFAILIVIMIIGVIQDKVFTWLDREFFPHKYQASEAARFSTIKKKSLVSMIFDYVFDVIGWIALLVYFVLMINDYTGFLGDFQSLRYLFGDTVWVIHLVVTALLIYKLWKWNKVRTDRAALQSVKSHGTA